MKAILLPYCCDQNEPSIPLPTVYNLPNNVKMRNAKLKALFIEHVTSGVEPSEITVRKGKRDDYGDIVVKGPYETYLFVTEVEDEE